MVCFPLFMVIALPVGLLIGSVILRSAIGFANKRVGPADDAMVESRDEDDWADYPIPGARTEPRAQIPVPSVGGGMLMVLCIVVVNFIVGAAINLVLGEGFAPGPRRGGGLLVNSEILARLVTFPAGFLVMAGLLAAMLPTTFRRGCLVAFFCVLICLGIAAILFVPMYLLGWR
jgi:hypothetical protein